MTCQAVVALLAVLLIGAVVGLVLLYRRYRLLTARYSAIIDVDAAVAKSKRELERYVAETEAAEAEGRRRKERLNQDYASAKEVFDRLRHEVGLLEENVEDISFGIYKPHYKFDSSDEYRRELESIRARQKALVKDGRAAVAGVEWQVGGSKREGAKMQKQYLKLMLRAFNGECDAAVARVTWTNVGKMEERINKAFEAVNDLGGVMQMSITAEYHKLKLAELRLEHETADKKHEEAEEQRRIKEAIREEEKALREAERAQQEAEKEEQRYEKALEKARAEMEKAQGGALEELNLKVSQLKQALQKAHEMKEKATSMAQLTRSGHVYIISNVGSFGENVFRIGMTRRLEPLDRVKELGDASVPFEFDVHAMVYSEDAPTLEGEFHRQFEKHRVNLVNDRKEFFSVTMEELERFVSGRKLRMHLTRLAEAKEYRQSVAIREAGRRGELASIEAGAAFLRGSEGICATGISSALPTTATKHRR